MGEGESGHITEVAPAVDLGPLVFVDVGEEAVHGIHHRLLVILPLSGVVGSCNNNEYIFLRVTVLLQIHPKWSVLIKLRNNKYMYIYM